MFKNIGGKMKFFAEAMAWIGIILSVVVGIILCIEGNNVRNGEALIVGGIFLMFFGSLVSYIGSWLLYGFGELVENSCMQTQLLLKMEKQKAE